MKMKELADRGMDTKILCYPGTSKLDSEATNEAYKE
jgi:hypothetical protein